MANGTVQDQRGDANQAGAQVGIVGGGVSQAKNTKGQNVVGGSATISTPGGSASVAKTFTAVKVIAKIGGESKKEAAPQPKACDPKHEFCE